jgi:hypothetical protein
MRTRFTYKKSCFAYTQKYRRLFQNSRLRLRAIRYSGRTEKEKPKRAKVARMKIDISVNRFTFDNAIYALKASGFYGVHSPISDCLIRIEFASDYVYDNLEVADITALMRELMICSVDFQVIN